VSEQRRAATELRPREEQAHSEQRRREPEAELQQQRAAQAELAHRQALERGRLAERQAAEEARQQREHAELLAQQRRYEQQAAGAKAERERGEREQAQQQQHAAALDEPNEQQVEMIDEGVAPAAPYVLAARDDGDALVVVPGLTRADLRVTHDVQATYEELVVAAPRVHWHRRHMLPRHWPTSTPRTALD
jgi:hypothetical protein